MGTFFGVGPKHAISEEARTFLVAFPGLNISKVPAARDRAIAAAAKAKGGKPYDDGPIKPESQAMMKPEIEKSLNNSILGIGKDLEEIFKEMWPDFNLVRRALVVPE